MIEDHELRALFKIESEEHLQHLDEGLLRLESNPTDDKTLQEMFREAHSLKGDARMISLSEVETIAHQFEGILDTARQGQATLSQEMMDRLYQGLDAMRGLVHEAVTGESAGVDVWGVLAQPSWEENAAAQDAPSATDSTWRSSQEAIGSEPMVQPPKGEVRPPPAATQDPPLTTLPPQSETDAGRYRIETIRVESQKLDTLMTQAGELSVMKNRIALRLSKIEEVTGLWEEWSRDAFSHRSLLGAVERGSANGAAKRLTLFHEREQLRLERLGVLLNQLRNAVYEDNARLDLVANELEEGIRTLRLLPLSTIFSLFPRLVRDLAREQAKEVGLVIAGEETTADKRILEEMKDPLMHMVRNAIAHGIELPEERERGGKPGGGSIRLRAYQTATNIVIEVADDGRGLDLETIKSTALRRGLCGEEELAAMAPAQVQSLIFASGFSTSAFVTDISGRGVGLDVVRTNVERLKGTLQVESSPGVGCTLRVQLPITLATARVLIVQVDARTYAVPVEFVQTTRLVSQPEIFSMEGRETIVLDGQPVSVARLSDLLEVGPKPSTVSLNSTPNSGQLPCIVVATGEGQFGLLVDALLDEQEVVLKPLGAMLKQVRNVSGVTILGTGEICMVLNPRDLLQSLQKRAAPTAPEKPLEEVERKRVILLVEDSITTRTQEKRILEGAGYEVVAAVDGIDAFNKLGSRPFDAVVTDIQMPNLDGLTLTAKIRQDKKYQELPIILVTALASEEDKRRGIEVGASAYITKSAFDQKVLLGTLGRLVS